MCYWLEKGIKELECWEQRIFTFLSERLSPDAISYYLDEYLVDVQGLYERSKKGEGIFTPSIYDAIAGITQIRSLLVEIKQPITENIPLEIAARFAVLTFRAGYTTGMITPGRGVEVLEWEVNRLEDQHQFAGKKALSEKSKKATDARYQEQRQTLDKAAVVARQLWDNGSVMLHHRMKQYLVEEYQDETGKYPFLSLPDKSLLETCKRVAKEIKRPDLISGQKKSS
jgi:hypothetical protein